MPQFRSTLLRVALSFPLWAVNPPCLEKCDTCKKWGETAVFRLFLWEIKTKTLKFAKIMTIEEQLAEDANSKEELTTAMQAEFMEGEMSPFELDVLGVYGAMRRGLSKADACKKYNMTIQQYDANIDRCMKL